MMPLLSLQPSWVGQPWWVCNPQYTRQKQRRRRMTTVRYYMAIIYNIDAMLNLPDGSSLVILQHQFILLLIVTLITINQHHQVS